MQGLFSRLSEDLESKAGASEIEKALEDMTFKIDQASNEQTRLQRLGRTLGKDQNSSAAMKRLQIELEQVCNGGGIDLALGFYPVVKYSSFRPEAFIGPPPPRPEGILEMFYRATNDSSPPRVPRPPLPAIFPRNTRPARPQYLRWFRATKTFLSVRSVCRATARWGASARQRHRKESTSGTRAPEAWAVREIACWRQAGATEAVVVIQAELAATVAGAAPSVRA